MSDYSDLQTKKGRYKTLADTRLEQNRLKNEGIKNRIAAIKAYQNSLTPEERKERAKKAGMAAAAKKRHLLSLGQGRALNLEKEKEEVLLMRDAFLTILQESQIPDDILKALSKMDIHPDKYQSVAQAVANAQVTVALSGYGLKKGSTEAFCTIRDTIGEKPIEKIEQTGVTTWGNLQDMMLRQISVTYYGEKKGETPKEITLSKETSDQTKQHQATVDTSDNES